MYIHEVMTNNTEILPSNTTVMETAKKMAEMNAGLMPVYNNDKLVGIVTDRDLVVNAVAKGVSLDDSISSILSEPVLYCFKDDDTDTVLGNMSKNEVQRLVVLDSEENKQLVGVVSVGDIASKCESSDTAKSIVDCCKHYH
jgi:CBS domain-containing protein